MRRALFFPEAVTTSRRYCSPPLASHFAEEALIVTVFFRCGSERRMVFSTPTCITTLFTKSVFCKMMASTKSYTPIFSARKRAFIRPTSNVRWFSRGRSAYSVPG